MGGYYLIRTTTGWASSEVDPLVDPTRMRQTNPIAFRQAPSAAAGSARTAAPSPPKASTSRIPVPTVTSQATTFRPVPKPRTSLSIPSRQSVDETTVRSPAETRLTNPPRPAPRARSRTPQQPPRGHSPIRPPTRTRSPSRVHSRSPFRGNSPSRGRASTRDLAPQHPRGRSQSRTNSSASAPPVPAPRAYRGRSESRGRDRSSTPANGRKRSSSSPSPSRGPPPPKSKYRNHCPLCSERLHNVWRHHGVTHLPWYSDILPACWKCRIYEPQYVFLSRHRRGDHEDMISSEFTILEWGSLMFGALNFIANQLGVSDLSDLLDYVHRHQLYPQQAPSVVPFNPAEVYALRIVGRIFLGEEDMGELRVCPPSGVLALFHWHVLVLLISCLPSQARLDLLYLEDQADVTGAPYEMGPLPEFLAPDRRLEFIDSHMHLDLCCREAGFRPGSLEELEHHYDNGALAVTHVVANYAFPRYWEMASHHVRQNTDGRLATTFGNHPHSASEAVAMSQISHLTTLLDQPECVGLGEVGLDFSRGWNCRLPCRADQCIIRRHRDQRRFLRTVLPIAAQKNLTLVIHARGKTDRDGSAGREILEILQELNLTHLRIHRHCFVGSRQELEDWLAVLPSVKFGITAKFLSRQHQQETILRIPDHQLLLETDSPKLVPENFPTNINTPWWGIHLIREVARIRGVTPEFLLDTCNENARNLYRLQQRNPPLT